ncbi:MAG: hypothetical protein QM730_26885 [Anaerolineales bacterium]
MSEKNDASRIQLIVGVLGFIGVLLTVFVPIIRDSLAEKKGQPTQTPIIIYATPSLVDTPVPTDTVPPGEPTSTPAPATDTPVPTFTATPFPAGVDWANECISVLWRVYPESLSTAPNGNCYAEPVAGAFSVRGQKLEVFYSDRASIDGVVGLFVEIPSDALVEFTLHLNTIDSGELWMGIFAEPKIDSSGVAIGAPAGKVTNNSFVVHKMPGDNRYNTGKFRKDSADYLVSFDVSPSAVSPILEKYTTIDTVPVSSTNSTRWLFIGYKVLAGQTNVVSGTISDLKITPR